MNATGMQRRQGDLEERASELKSLQDELKGKIIVDVTNVMYLLSEESWGQVGGLLHT